jgi:hypothetical protein
MTDEEKQALQTAIKLYLDMGVLDRVSSSCKKFLARVRCKYQYAEATNPHQKLQSGNCYHGWG